MDDAKLKFMTEDRDRWCELAIKIRETSKAQTKRIAELESDIEIWRGTAELIDKRLQRLKHENKVRELEAEGMTTIDAQAVIDAQGE